MRCLRRLLRVGKAVEENIQQAQVWMKAVDAGVDMPLPDLPSPPARPCVVTKQPTIGTTVGAFALNAPAEVCATVSTTAVSTAASTAAATPAPGPVPQSTTVGHFRQMQGPVLLPRLARERVEAVPAEKYLLIDCLHNVTAFETLEAATEEALRRITERAQP